MNPTRYLPTNDEMVGDSGVGASFYPSAYDEPVASGSTNQNCWASPGVCAPLRTLPLGRYGRRSGCRPGPQGDALFNSVCPGHHATLPSPSPPPAAVVPTRIQLDSGPLTVAPAQDALDTRQSLRFLSLLHSSSPLLSELRSGPPRQLVPLRTARPGTLNDIQPARYDRDEVG